ncbi:MAG: ribonuclease P protein component [Burkholderiales bacterium]|nr:ribonuclease P protein component [Burkholderiales bacterium]
MTSGLRLPRAARIRDEVILRALQRAGRVRGRWFVAAALANGLDESRLAVRVAKKVMKSAVARNRIRRCVREVFRQLRPGLAPSDFLVSLVQPYRNRSLQAARQDIERLLVQAASR